MKIVHVLSGLDPGGAERYVVALAERQQRLGHAVAIVYFSTHAGLAEAAASSGIRVISVSRSRLIIPTIRALAEVLRAQDPDIIHTHLIRADMIGSLAHNAARRAKLISTRHNDDAFLRAGPIRLVYRWSARNASAVITISNYLERYCRRRTVPPDVPIWTVHYGLPEGDAPYPRPVAREKLGLSPGQLAVGIVARLTRQKGQVYALHAWAKVARTLPGAKLVLVGQGEDQGALQHTAAELGIADSVSFAGFRRDAPLLMRAFDVFLLPSLWEGFGLVLLEAMAGEVPVIASDVSAIPEIVSANETGLLVPAADADAIARSLIELLSDDELRRSLGASGARRVQQHFSMDVSSRENLRVYEAAFR